MMRELAKKRLGEKKFSENIFRGSKAAQFLYEDKPNLAKVKEFTKSYELEYLESLNAFEWFIYPFVKTITIGMRRLGCCLRDDEKRARANRDSDSE